MASVIRNIKRFSFTGLVEEVNFNFITTAIFLPHHIVIELPKGRQRVSGSINGIPFSLAIQYRKDKGRYISVGSSLKKSANIVTGDEVDVVFKIIDSSRVELPEELERVVPADAKGKKIWRSIPSGSQGTLADFISSVQHIDSRMRCAIEIVRKAKLGELIPTQKIRKNRNKQK
jgi:hypothetical protein